MSPYERVLYIIAILSMCIHLWGLYHVKDGQFAFDYALRKYMINRRIIQMCVYMLVVSCVILNFPMGVLVLIAGLSGYQALGWVDFQVILGNRPLDVTTTELAKEVVTYGRKIGHSANNNITIVSLLMDEILENKELTPELKELIIEYRKSIEAAHKGTQQLHEHLRDLAREDGRFIDPLDQQEIPN